MREIISTIVAILILSLNSEGAEKVKIGLIGDSTVAVQSGWGPAFAARFNENAEILNYAKNGATLDSLSKRLDELLKKNPDYVLIQFGHNDQKRYDTNGYAKRLKSYVERIKNVGGKPIIVSSVVRRSFGKDGKIVSGLAKTDKFTFKDTLDAYAMMAGAVAKEEKVPFIDLYTISEKHHNSLGREASMTYNFKEGDRTHFNKKGAKAIAELVIAELKVVVPELAGHFWANEGNKNEGKNMTHTEYRETFEKAVVGDWKEVLSDNCTSDWKKQWFLDGEVGKVTTDNDGMTLTAGPEFKNDAHHMVLWTKESFKGDLKIEYDYTRLDNENRCVNIIYIQATGSGQNGFDKDITNWNDQRKVPAMRTYFNNMNTYHISYAAFGNDGKATSSYIRGRRYMPHRTGLKGTDLKPEFWSETLFAQGVKHHITIIKKDREIFMKVENPDEAAYFFMANTDLPAITEGRIGLRHMFTRSARYKNFSVSVPE